jgi:hypothetical protein
MIYSNTDGEFGKYIVQELREPDIITVDVRALYKKFAKRILWMDGDIVPGAFQMNTAWWTKAQPRDPLFPEHTHDYDELIGFFSSDPEEPYNLHAVIEFALAGETHRIDRSSLIFVPGGMSHNPMRLLTVEKPVFHLSIVMSSQYSGDSAYK